MHYKTCTACVADHIGSPRVTLDHIESHWATVDHIGSPRPLCCIQCVCVFKRSICSCFWDRQSIAQLVVCSLLVVLFLVVLMCLCLLISIMASGPLHTLFIGNIPGNMWEDDIVQIMTEAAARFQFECPFKTLVRPSRGDRSGMQFAIASWHNKEKCQMFPDNVKFQWPDGHYALVSQSKTTTWYFNSHDSWFVRRCIHDSRAAAHISSWNIAGSGQTVGRRQPGFKGADRANQ